MARRKTPAIDRLRAKLVKRRGHWLWTGSLDSSGHGQIRGDDGRLVMVHRLMYEHEVGPIPEGHDLDHQCPFKRCVRPAHLRPETVSEHRRITQQRKTRCVKGHPFDTRDKNQRICSTCRRARWRAWKARQAQT